jgi:hypothetical protein
MISRVRDIIKYLAEKPNTLFLTDSLGALITTFFLFVVLRNFNEYFGMPVMILTYLAAIAACFFIYSTACYLFLKDHWPAFIRAISIANLLYCILTLGLVIAYYAVLTILGITYFLAEITLVLGLVYIELNVAKAIE